MTRLQAVATQLSGARKMVKIARYEDLSPRSLLTVNEDTEHCWRPKLHRERLALERSNNKVGERKDEMIAEKEGSFSSNSLSLTPRPSPCESSAVANGGGKVLKLAPDHEAVGGQTRGGAIARRNSCSIQIPAGQGCWPAAEKEEAKDNRRDLRKGQSEEAPLRLSHRCR